MIADVWANIETAMSQLGYFLDLKEADAIADKRYTITLPGAERDTPASTYSALRVQREAHIRIQFRERADPRFVLDINKEIERVAIAVRGTLLFEGFMIEALGSGRVADIEFSVRDAFTDPAWIATDPSISSSATVSIAVGVTETLPPGSDATVVNSGTSRLAVFDFGIPAGEDGQDGPPGEDGPPGADGPNLVSTATDSNITGLIKGTGTKIAAASAGTDYQAPLGYTAEDAANKVTALSGSSTDAQYPSAKKVYDIFNALKNAFCEVYFNGGTFPLSNAFTKIPFSQQTGYYVFNLGNNWDAANNRYTVPVSGTYEIMTKLRLNDFATAETSYGHGADIALQDSAAFQWFETTQNRNGSLNSRISHFDAGQNIFAQAYVDFVNTFEVIDDFEQASTGLMQAVWAGTGVAVTRETTIKQQGSSALKAVVDATPNRILDGAVSRDFGLSSHIRVYARSATAGATFKMRFEDYDGNFTTLARTFTIAAADTWQEFVIDITSLGEDIDPSGVVKVSFSNLNAGTTYYFDALDQYWEYITAVAASIYIKLLYQDAL